MKSYPYTIYRERAGNWKVFEGVVADFKHAKRRALEISRNYEKESVVVYWGQKKVAVYFNGAQFSIP